MKVQKPWKRNLMQELALFQQQRRTRGLTHIDLMTVKPEGIGDLGGLVPIVCKAGVVMRDAQEEHVFIILWSWAREMSGKWAWSSFIFVCVCDGIGLLAQWRLWVSLLRCFGEWEHFPQISGLTGDYEIWHARWGRLFPVGGWRPVWVEGKVGWHLVWWRILTTRGANWQRNDCLKIGAAQAWVYRPHPRKPLPLP